MMRHDTVDERMTERFQLCAAKAWIQKIDEWAWENRIRTRAEAIRILIERALEAEKSGYSGTPEAAAGAGNQPKGQPLLHRG
jgi:metal-responsive CopG/Arc/MetJ family transcriptional regulator